MSDEKLLPCPWCGGELSQVSVSEGNTFRWRKVDGCCADGPEIRHDTMADDQEAAEADSRARAIAAWNRRARVAQRELSDEEIYAVITKAAAEYRKGRQGVRGQLVRPTDDPDYVLARAVERAVLAAGGRQHG